MTTESETKQQDHRGLTELRDPRVVALRDADDRQTSGGKAATLAAVSRAGHRVPDGFVVTVEGARALAAIADLVRAAVARLGAGPFAVRSSAVVEDGAQHSFAGQLETFLDVMPEHVLGAIENCIASARGARVVAYAGGEVGDVAVIVQQMVPAECAGVAFTADPQTGVRDTTIIEAVAGLGDALVGGAVSPERWRNAERVQASTVPVLDERRARAIAAVGKALQRQFGAPQDVEWAFRGDELFVLQSRPITALPAAPVALDDELPKGRWQRDDHHGVLSPLGWAWFQPYPQEMARLMRMLGMPLKRMEVKRVRGHLYARMVMPGADAKRSPPAWIIKLAMRLIPAARRGEKTIKAFFEDNKFLETSEQWEREWKPEMRNAISSAFVENVRSLTDEQLLGRIDQALKISARGLGIHAECGGPGLFGVGKLLLFVEDRLGWPPARVFDLLVGSSQATTDAQRTVERIAADHTGETSKLARAPRTWGELHRTCPQLGAALARFLADNRLRVLHYDPKNPMLGEKPELVLSMLEVALSSERSPSDADAKASAAREEAMAVLTSEEDRRELDALLAIARKGYGLRDENGIDTVSRPAGLLRWFVLELGRRLESVIGSREHAVYLYPEEHEPALRGELADLRALVEKRRGEESWAIHNRGPMWLGSPPPPMPPPSVMPPYTGKFMRVMEWMQKGETPIDNPDGALRGIGMGQRVAEGVARVVHRAEDVTSLRAGEILVCRITSPEWTVAMVRARAIVTNEGGLLSHPAIIAREYGIPAVLGVGGATQSIRTGDVVRVDPVVGVVEIVRR